MFRIIRVYPDPESFEELVRSLPPEDGWVLASWQVATVGNTCAHTVYAILQFQRHEDDGAALVKVEYGPLLRYVEKWRDRQKAELEREHEPHIIPQVALTIDERIRLEGSVEAFEAVIEALENAVKW